MPGRRRKEETFWYGEWMVTALQVVRADACGVAGGARRHRRARCRLRRGTTGQPGTRSAGAVGQLRVVATTVLSARMRDLTVASPALGETVKVRLLLPVRYWSRPAVRWPVLYLLHGCCDTYQSWTRSTDVEALTAHSDVLVVMPDGGKAVSTPTG